MHGGALDERSHTALGASESFNVAVAESVYAEPAPTLSRMGPGRFVTEETIGSSGRSGRWPANLFHLLDRRRGQARGEQQQRQA
ncbi:MAG: hypothetical protein R2724_26195 [Bryobacterales bacterium]